MKFFVRAILLPYITSIVTLLVYLTAWWYLARKIFKEIFMKQKAKQYKKYIKRQIKKTAP